jgi:Phosphoheptose isomerase
MQIDNSLTEYVNDLIRRYPQLELSKDSIIEAYLIMEGNYSQGGKLLVCGNGGSAADANHIVGELMKGFYLPRKVNKEFAEKLMNVDYEKGMELAEKLQGALPALALDNHNALNTAYSNDVDGVMCYAQQVMGYGDPKDTLFCISTSGNSKNVMYAVITAKAKGMKTIMLTGKTGGAVKEMVDVCICVNEMETYKIQEMHLPIYHCLCLMLEHKFFS